MPRCFRKVVVNVQGRPHASATVHEPPGKDASQAVSECKPCPLLLHACVGSCSKLQDVVGKSIEEGKLCA